MSTLAHHIYRNSAVSHARRMSQQLQLGNKKATLAVLYIVAKAYHHGVLQLELCDNDHGLVRAKAAA